MARNGEMRYIDKKNDEAIELAMDVFGFSTRRKASEWIGEVFLSGFNQMGEEIKRQMEEKYEENKGIPEEDQGFDFSSIGFK